MKKITVITASALLAVSSAAGFAAPKSKGATKTTKGASEFSPGDQMKDLGTKTTKGASDFSPGDTMNDARKKK